MNEQPPYGMPPYGPPPAAPPPAVAMCAVHPQTPAVGLCPRCGAYMCPWCQRMGADGVVVCGVCSERLDVGGPVPWDLRQELGFFRAFWQTFKESLSGPDRFFARAARTPTPRVPVFYSTMAILFGQLWVILLYAGLGTFMAVSGKDRAAGIGMAVGFTIMIPLMAPVSALMQIYVFGGITHLFARLFGGQGSYTATARALAFAIGPYCIGIIPYLGGMAGYVASIVLQVYAVKHAHRLSGGRAAAAVLTPIGILLVLCCGGYVALIAAVFAAKAH